MNIWLRVIGDPPPPYLRIFPKKDIVFFFSASRCLSDCRLWRLKSVRPGGLRDVSFVKKCTIFETKCETAFRVGSHVASLVVGQTLCCSIWICPSNQQVWPRLFSQNYRKCIFKRSLSLFAQPLSLLFPPNRFGCAVLFLSLRQRFGQPHHTCKETAYLILPGQSSVVQIMLRMKVKNERCV